MTESKYKCVVCSEEHDTNTGLFDAQLGGLVCKDCAVHVFYAVRYLGRAGINRPFCEGDVNQGNFKRFVIP